MFHRIYKHLDDPLTVATDGHNFLVLTVQEICNFLATLNQMSHDVRDTWQISDSLVMNIMKSNNLFHIHLSCYILLKMCIKQTKLTTAMILEN
jgi:hypothetical protein